MMCYMFALGIEMDPYALFKRPSKDIQVAWAGIITTFIIACCITPLLHYFSGQHIVEFTLSLSTLLASTASPVLTRLITSLKIGKSDIGKLIIAAGMYSDFICSLLLSVGYISMPLDTLCIGSKEKEGHITDAVIRFCGVLAQTLFTATVSPIFMNWVNNENPEGKPMKGSHLVLSIAFMVMSCACSKLYYYNPILSAFLTGVCFPREGRVSKWVLSKINYLLTTIFFPIFFLWMGYEADFRQFQPGDPGTWTRLFVPVVIVMVGKVAGIVVSGVILGFHWPESIAIGLLLTTKGHFHIYMAIKVASIHLISLLTIKLFSHSCFALYHIFQFKILFSVIAKKIKS